MLRTYAALAAVGLLALVLLAGLNGGGNAIAGLWSGNNHVNVLVNSNTGQPVTLEAVKKDIDWHHDTARKLRALD
ncbi:MAG: hypothetical protein ACFB13_06305 [Kiloniellaceae bacterium]